MGTQDFMDGLTEAQKEALKNCKDTSEIMAYLENEGIELTDEQLDAVSGGLNRNISAGSGTRYYDTVGWNGN